MTDIAIKVENLSKKYFIGESNSSYKTLRDSVSSFFTSPFRRFTHSPNREEIWALKDVSFEIKRGEVVGIIGRNGAGKSTLLKILSRITEPTEGHAEIRGRVGSLLEVGTGFHPELSGRENIYLNGAILGMKKAEIERKFDEIVAFAEVEKFIDTPVKHYSSGMYVRLAFAVAAHLEPEILLVDEVLAVGDAAFQKKCLGKMGGVAREGRTVLFVSHNMGAVENLCRSCILLERGSIETQGDARFVIDDYIEKVLPRTSFTSLAERMDRTGSGRIRLVDFFIENPEGKRLDAVQAGQDCIFVFGYRCPDGNQPSRVEIAFQVKDSRDIPLFLHQNLFTGELFDNIPVESQFRCRIPRLPLVPGRYYVSARVQVGGEEADFPAGAVGYFDVMEGDFFRSGHPGITTHGSFLVNGSWSVLERD